MKRIGLIILLIIHLCCGWAARKALVIGNAAYSEKRLTNPVNDATDLAAKLRGLGFETTLHSNLDKEGFELAVDNFARGIGRNDEVVFFYAGHGVQIEGINYLIPVNTRIEDETQCKFRAVQASYIFESLRRAAVSIVILDACRNNPYSWRRTGVRGLAPPVEVEFGSQYIIFSTSANSEADDGSGRNSPFTAALIKHIDTPGLQIDDLIRNVGNELRQATSTRQTPAVYGLLSERYYFAKADPVQPDTYRPPVASPTPVPPSEPVQPGLHRLTGSLRVTSDFETEFIINRQSKGVIKPGFALSITDLQVGSLVVEYFYQNAKLGENVRIEEGQTTRLEIKTATIQQRYQTGNRFTIKSDPTDAELTIEGYPSFKANPPFLIFDPIPAQYTLILKRDRYDDARVEIKTQSTRSAEQTIKLTPKFGGLVITSVPTGSEVWINDRQVGVTPLNLSGHSQGLDPGTYWIKLEPSSDQYLPVHKEIRIEAAKVHTEQLIHDANVGILSVESDYYPVIIKRNGQELAILQRKGQIEVPPGTATFSFEPQVSLERPGMSYRSRGSQSEIGSFMPYSGSGVPYKSHSAELTIIVNEVLPINLILIPAPATLTFVSDSNKYDVIITNRITGRSEKVKSNAWNVYPGSYSITATQWGYYAIERDIDLKEKDRFEHRIDGFEPLPHEIMRPYTKSKRHQKYGLISMGLTVGASLFMFYTADQAHKDYMAADTHLAAQNARKDFETARNQFYGTCSLNVISAGYYIWSLVNTSRIRAHVEQEMYSRTRSGK
ncbi:MAG: caspase family protein [Candidatus Cloacimonetes bacterium]|nr:caspase family protein [Candidatus Cloacimonadota bacterium]